MNKKPVGTVKRSKSFRLTPHIAETIELKSHEEGISEAVWLEKLVMNYLVDKVDKTDIYMYHLEELKKEIKKHDAKLEELCFLFLDYLHFFFRTQPGIKEDKPFIDEINRANETVIKFLSLHRNKLKKQGPFMNQIFGDFLDDDGIPNFSQHKEDSSI